MRGNQTLNLSVKPVLSKTEDPKEQRYRLGFLNQGETKVTTLPFGQALQAFRSTKIRNILCCFSSWRRRSFSGRFR